MNDIIEMIKNHMSQLRPVDLDGLCKVDTGEPTDAMTWDHAMLRSVIGVYARKIRDDNTKLLRRYVDLRFNFVFSDGGTIWFRSECFAYTFTVMLVDDEWRFTVVDQDGREGDGVVRSKGVCLRFSKLIKGSTDNIRPIRLTYDLLHGSIDRFI